ncbi:MAG: hypothetical protein P4M05_09835 [Bradyrhizobium sp.]|nr:hypothetical protein [Bradyrhizobium sp.]
MSELANDLLKAPLKQSSKTEKPDTLKQRGKSSFDAEALRRGEWDFSLGVPS